MATKRILDHSFPVLHGISSATSNQTLVIWMSKGTSVYRLMASSDEEYTRLKAIFTEPNRKFRKYLSLN